MSICTTVGMFKAMPCRNAKGYTQILVHDAQSPTSMYARLLDIPDGTFMHLFGIVPKEPCTMNSLSVGRECHGCGEWIVADARDYMADPCPMCGSMKDVEHFYHARIAKRGTP